MLRVSRSFLHPVRAASTALLFGLLIAGSLLAWLVAARGGEHIALALTVDAALVAAALALVFADRSRPGGWRRHGRADAGDAAIEALILVEDGRIVDANRSFLRLSGYESVRAIPDRVTDMLPVLDAGPDAAPGSGKAERLLVTADKGLVPVEIRPWRASEGNPQVLAVRRIGGR